MLAYAVVCDQVEAYASRSQREAAAAYEARRHPPWSLYESD